MSDKEEYRAFARTDLTTWAPDGERQAQAWNRLRRVCIELRLKVPTMQQVKEMEQDLSGRTYYAAKERWSADGAMFDEEFASLVICEPEEGEGMIFVQFDSGYRLE